MKFKAFTRSVQGSSASRRLRRAGKVPAILYGGGAETELIALDHNQIFHDLEKDAFYASILDMKLEDKDVKVLLRAVQWHPYKPEVLHLDFQRVRDDVEITTRVPLNFMNAEESEAVRVHDQVVSQLLNDLEITCLPAQLPAAIDVDLSGLEENQTITLEDIELPEGVSYAGASTDPNPALATALSARVELEEEVDAPEVEPELVDADEADEGDEEEE